MRKPKIAFIGLGIMGFEIAGHISKAGYDIAVWNRTFSKVEKWLSRFQGIAAKQIEHVVEEADIVISCISDDEALKEIVLSKESGVINHMKDGSIFIDHSTVSIEISKEINRIFKSKKNIDFLDAPVSGGEIGAQKGTLTVMVGGDEKSFKRAKEIMNLYASAITYMGQSGNGQLTKMVNQIAHAGAIQSLSEALNFGEKMGLDIKKAITVMTNGAARTWHLENRGESMVDDKFDFGFANKHMLKDLRLAISEAVKNKLPLPVATLVSKYYQKLVSSGLGDLDFSSIIKLLRDGK